MPLTVPLIGKELCFWCVETFRKCPIHENSNVFWNDVTVRSFSDESDGFRIVDEKELINVERSVLYTESGTFVLPPNGSSLTVSTTFTFDKCEEKIEVPISNEVPKVKKIKKTEVFKKPKLPVNRELMKPKKKNVYTKIHKNAIKTMAREYKKGKKCDESEKVFLCDICEFSFTLRHNLQSHVVQFHGKIENVSEEKLSLLKDMLPRKEISDEKFE